MPPPSTPWSWPGDTDDVLPLTVNQRSDRRILEVANDTGDRALSISRARVPPGVTTEWHRLIATEERIRAAAKDRRGGKLEAVVHLLVGIGEEAAGACGRLHANPRRQIDADRNHGRRRSRRVLRREACARRAQQHRVSRPGDAPRVVDHRHERIHEVGIQFDGRRTRLSHLQ